MKLAFAAPTPVHLRLLHGRSRRTTRPVSRPIVAKPTWQPKCAQEASQAKSPADSSAMAAAAAAFILKKAATAYVKGERRPDGSTVSTALRQLEKEQKRNKVKSDVDLLYGQWRLVLTADEKTKNPFLKALYFPVRAHQTFRHGEGVDIFDNSVFLFGGAASLRVIGPFRWVARMNRLEFTVDKVDIKIGSWKWSKDVDQEDSTANGSSKLEGRTAKTLPFFTFFCIRPDVLAARGRSGGLALYARVPDDEYL